MPFDSGLDTGVKQARPSAIVPAHQRASGLVGTRQYAASASPRAIIVTIVMLAQWTVAECQERIPAQS
jgi:hypothetical protein